MQGAGRPLAAALDALMRRRLKQFAWPAGIDLTKLHVFGGVRAHLEYYTGFVFESARSPG